MPHCGANTVPWLQPLQQCGLHDAYRNNGMVPVSADTAICFGPCIKEMMEASQIFLGCWRSLAIGIACVVATFPAEIDDEEDTRKFLDRWRTSTVSLRRRDNDAFR